MSGAKETIVIVGGAIMGSFTAYFLKKQGFTGKVIVFERDPTYQHSSTALSAAAIRTQFGCDFNAKMSLFGAEMFRNIKSWFGPDADIGFEERGYLILGKTDDGQELLAQELVERQNAFGADVSVLTPAELCKRFPWINSKDLGCGTLGNKHEGWFDAWCLLRETRAAAKNMGVDYVCADVTGVTVTNSRVTGVTLADGTSITADWVINAAGPLSAKVMASLGIHLPVEPRKRTVFNIKTPLSTTNFPMLFDTSGAWIRPEGDGFICGIAPHKDSDPNAEGDFEPDYDLFEKEVWPNLAHRVPELENLRMTGAWAGHYEINTLDHNGIIGPHDEIANLMFATGFSGHGVMHAPSVGRGLAELIRTGNFETLDLSPLGYDRIKSNTPIKEAVVY